MIVTIKTKVTRISTAPRIDSGGGVAGLGAVFVVLATIMSLPIPFGNFMPGLAMALIAIGLIECDGVLILLGLLMGVATVVLMFTVVDALLSALQSFLS